jgi:uncharacterized membrane protein YfcA
MDDFERPTGIWRILEKLQTAGGVASILAFVIACTICAGYLLGLKDPPPILVNSLSIIIGFYFGSAVQNRDRMK